MSTKEEVIHALFALSAEDRLDVRRLLNNDLGDLDQQDQGEDAAIGVA